MNVINLEYPSIIPWSKTPSVQTLLTIYVPQAVWSKNLLLFPPNNQRPSHLTAIRIDRNKTIYYTLPMKLFPIEFEYLKWLYKSACLFR